MIMVDNCSGKNKNYWDELQKLLMCCLINWLMFVLIHQPVAWGLVGWGNIFSSYASKKQKQKKQNKKTHSELKQT